MHNFRPSINTVPPVVKNLIIINVLMLLATMLLEARGINLARTLGLHYIESPEFRPWQLFTHMNLFLDPEFQYWLASMFLAFLVAIAVAEILAQRKHRLALQALRTGRDCHPKGDHQ